MSNKITAKIKKLNMELAEKKITNNSAPSIANSNVLERTECKKQESTTSVSTISEKEEMPPKDSTKMQKGKDMQVSISF